MSRFVSCFAFRFLRFHTDAVCSIAQVLSLDGSSQVGRISKQWMGLVKEAFTDADTFGITCE